MAELKKEKELKEELKDSYIEKLVNFFTENGEEVLRIKQHEFAMPVTDSQNNEHFIKIVVSIPSGSRGGDEIFDGYAMAEDYKLKQKLKEEKKAKTAEAKAKKIEKDRKIREQKEALKKAHEKE